MTSAPKAAAALFAGAWIAGGALAKSSFKTMTELHGEWSKASVAASRKAFLTGRSSSEW